MLKKRRPFQILVPKDPKDMTREGGLVLPTYLTQQYRKLYLKDAGVVGGASHGSVFGIEMTIAEVKAVLQKYNSVYALLFLARLAAYIAHHGLKPVSKDELMRDLLLAAIQDGQERGLKVANEFLTIKDDQRFFIGPEVVNGAMALVIESGLIRTDGINVNAQPSEFCRVLLGLNDLVFDTTEEPGPMTRDKTIRLLRQNMAQAPFAGTMHLFSRRIHRFYSIFSATLNSLDANVRNQIDGYLEEAVGVRFDQLVSISFPISTFWIQQRDFKRNTVINLQNLGDSKLCADLRAFLERASLKPEEYSALLHKEQARLGDEFFKGPHTLRILVQYPFIRISNDDFVLLGPHLLLRKIELAVTGAFKDKRPRESQPVQVLFGPLGIRFEKYAQQLLQRVYPPSTSLSIKPLLEVNPKRKDGSELCDAIIDDPRACILFEMKFRPPDLLALDIRDPSVEKLRKWIESTFLLSEDKTNPKRKTRGALWQLAGAAKEVMDNVRGYVPEHIIPVVVVSEDIVFEPSLYSLLDAEIVNRGIFSGLEQVQPFVILSITELEFVTSCTFQGSKWSLHDVITKKSQVNSARMTNWTNFIRRLGIGYRKPDDLDATIDFLIEKAMAYFPEESVEEP